MKFIATIIVLMAVGCADTGDDDCNVDTQEGCQEPEEGGSDGGRDVPRDGKLLPWKPGLPAVSEQALSNVMPAHVWTPGFVSIVSGDTKFTVGHGGLNSWALRRYINAGNAMYTPLYNVNGVPETFLSRPLPDYYCPPGTYTGGIYCSNPLGQKVLITCPVVRVTSPTHYDFSFSGALVNPTYGFQQYYTTANQQFTAVRMVPEWYHPVPGTTTLKRMMTCYYRLPELQVIKR